MHKSAFKTALNTWDKMFSNYIILPTQTTID